MSGKNSDDDEQDDSEGEESFEDPGEASADEEDDDVSCAVDVNDEAATNRMNEKTRVRFELRQLF